MIKKTYENPESELIEVRFEEAFLQGTNGGYNSSNHTQYITGDPNDGYEEL